MTGSAPTRGHIRWAVVGLGQFARSRLLPALSRAPRARLVGVYTRDAEVRRTVAAEYSVTPYDSYDAVLADPRVHVVGLVTPHDLHAAQAIAAAAASKHVFVEKPMALTATDAAQMLAACSAASVGLYVGFHLRFHPAHQAARELIRSGRLGDLVWVSAQWAGYRDPDTGWRLDPASSGGAILTARGVHLLDLIRFVADAEFETVSGESNGFRPDRPVDDFTVALGRLSSGSAAQMICSRLFYGSDDGFEACGTRGRLVCRGSLPNEDQSTLVMTTGDGETFRTFSRVDMLAAELDYVSAALGGAEPEPQVGATGADGARVTAVTEALVASIGSRRLVHVNDIYG